MHSIKIDKHLFYLPSGWEELTPSQVKKITLTGGKGAERDLFALFLLSSKKLKRWLRRIDPVKVVAISECLSWLQEPRTVTSAAEEVEPLVPSFWHKGRRYYFPENSLNDVTVGEWMWVEVYLQDLVNDPQNLDQILHSLLATICRPLRGRRERKAKDYDGYPRQCFNPEMIPAFEKRYKGVPSWIYYVVQDYLLRCQQMLKARYGIIFNGEKKGGLNLGWKGQVMSIAEARIFGNEKQVEREGMHNICIYLVKKLEEKKELDKKLEAIRNG